MKAKRNDLNVCRLFRSPLKPSELVQHYCCGGIVLPVNWFAQSVSG